MTAAQNSAGGWRLALRARSAALLGGLAERQPGVAAATSLLPRPSRSSAAPAAGPNGDHGAQGDPVVLLLGSSLKGVLRHDAARLAEARGLADCRGHDQPHGDADGNGDAGCLVCRVFGASNRAGSLAVRSATAGATLGSVTSVAIDRRTRTADRAGKRLWTELRSVADFTVDLVPVTPLTSAESQFVELLLDWEATVGVRLGRRKSSGSGAFELAWTALAEPPPATRVPATTDSTPRRYLLQVEAVEPLRLAGTPRRVFFRDALESIQASTLRGAVGWALARRGDGDLATDLFIDRPIRVTAGIHDAAAGLPAQWLALLECRAPTPHRVDPTRDALEHALQLLPLWQPSKCPVEGCGSPLKPAPPPRPPMLVIEQTEIERASGRGRHGMLFAQALVAPGATFTAEMTALPEQAAALAGLEEILVGGNRSRGLGRARLRVTEPDAALPPVAARVERTVRTLRGRGASLGGDQVAVIGLVTDGFAPEPLRSLLGRHGMTVLTANVRMVLRGSYDETAGHTRPLRRLLAAGSWVAVRGRNLVGALEILERDGADDPEGLQPLWLRVRDDLDEQGDASDVAG